MNTTVFHPISHVILYSSQTLPCHQPPLITKHCQLYHLIILLVSFFPAFPPLLLKSGFHHFLAYLPKYISNLFNCPKSLFSCTYHAVEPEQAFHLSNQFSYNFLYPTEKYINKIDFLNDLYLASFAISTFIGPLHPFFTASVLGPQPSLIGILLCHHTI